MIAELFQTISEGITAFFTMLGSGLNSVVALFYNETNGFTMIGILTIIGVVGGLGWGLFNLIRGAIKVR